MMADQGFDPQSPDSHVQSAFDLYKAGDAKAAMKAAEAGMPEADDTVSLRLVLALSLRRLGRQKSAIPILEEALKDAPDRADIWTLSGMCHRDLAEREKASADFRHAIKADPSYDRAKYQLAVVSQEMGHNQESVALFEWYLKTTVGQKNALAWSLYAVALRRVSRFDDSVVAIQRAIDMAPDDITSRNALVITLHQSGDEAATIAAATTALEMKDAYATTRAAEMNLGLSLNERLQPFDRLDRSKNIISFSLWGDNPVYTHGAIVNAQLAPHVYSSWRCRFYCDDSVPTHIIDELRRLGSEVHMVCDPDLSELKPLWRFLVSDDEGVDRFICRDADSRLNSQEAVAVDDWIASERSFHVMRDHPYHMEVILAGMWGGVARVLPNIRQQAKIAMGYSRNKWNDQEFLRDVVWPLIRDRAQVHDSVFQFRGAEDFPPYCRLPGKVHVGGAIKAMPEWPLDAWKMPKNGG